MSKKSDRTYNYNYFSLSNKAENVLFFIILLIGLLLRFYFYFSNRDLGADEAHLALNFIHRGYIELVKPLENFQSAPIFFLWSVESITRIFGFSELALRLVPFLISIFSFPFFYFFVRALIKNKIIALLAFLLFALNFSILYFATELKPYTIDIAAFTLIGFLLFSDWKFIVKRRMTLLAVVGALLLLFSISSTIILLCASLYMVSQWRRFEGFKKSHWVWASWGIVFILNYFLFIYKHPYAEGMKNIWSWAFCPKNIFSNEFCIFINDRIQDTLFSNLLFFSKELYFNYLLLFITLVAIMHIVIKKNYTIFLFTLYPIIIHLALSMLQLYPFYQRFILYLLPAMIILFSYGIVIVIQFISQKTHWVWGVALLCFFIFATNIKSIKKYNSTTKERAIKPVFDYIDKYYPTTPVLVVTPYTLYYYYSETGRVKNKNFKAIDWELTPKDFYNHKLIESLSQNYLLLYSIGDNFDGYGETLDDLNKKGLIVNQYNHSIFGLTELKPDSLHEPDDMIKNINYKSFAETHPIITDSKNLTPLWDNSPVTYPASLKKGKYAILLTARGDAANGIYPHLKISFGQKVIAECTLKKEMERFTFFFEIDSVQDATISIAMDNDETINEEDRNAFIQSVYILNN